MTNNLLFEIGVEEIPAQYVKSMRDSFAEVLSKDLTENLLDFKRVEVKYSPRRLVAFVSELCDTQKVVTELVKGPSLDRAFNENNDPTPALQGFLRGKGKTESDIEIKELNGAKYVYVSVSNTPKMTAEILPELLKNTISKIYLPNAMRWANYSFKFVRPIRWLLAVYGDQIINFEIECCKSSDFTKGHRTLANHEIKITSANGFEEILKQNYVILDAEERKNIILSQIHELETDGKQVEVDDDLLDEIVNLVEYPQCYMASFPSEFLSLPDPVIITPMKDHQRYFPVFKDGKLTNNFVFVRNGDTTAIEKVAHGNERVLNARLKDGEFFYNEDIKTTLSEKAQKLGEVVYQEKLGSMQEKSKRVNEIAKLIANYVSVDTAKIDKITTLFKADLVSKVVGEFSELQGIMGGIYARLDGLDDEISTAIGEQYLPVVSGGNLPTQKLSAVIAIADKLDSIMGLTAVGLQAKGAGDQYGLRRQAFGILAIQQKFNFTLNLNEIISKISHLYNNFLQDNSQNLQEYEQSIRNFFAQRIKGILIDDNKVSHEIAEQIPLNSLNIFEIIKKAKLLENINNEQWFVDAKQAFFRIEKILKNKSVSTVICRCNLVLQDEINLFNEVEKILPKYGEQLSNNDFENALKTLSGLTTLINTLFDNNLIMVEDPEVCQNRVNFLYKLLSLYTSILTLC